MKLSARNILKGKVKALKPGAINTEVIMASLQKGHAKYIEIGPDTE